MTAPMDGEANANEATGFPPYDPEKRGQFGAKLHFLFQKRLRPLNDAEYAQQVKKARDPHLPRGVREWHNIEVARAIKVSDPLIGYLRKGERSNPTFNLIHKLAAFFRVPVRFLAETDEDYSRPALELKFAEFEAENQDFLIDDQSQVFSLAYGLNVLFDVMVPPGADTSARFTEVQVASAIGVPVAELRTWRKGSTTDVDVEKVRALAAFFGVDPVYLIGDPSDKVAAETEQDLATLRMLTENRIRSVAARKLADQIGSLQPDQLATVRKLLEFFAHEEQKEMDGKDNEP